MSKYIYSELTKLSMMILSLIFLSSCESIETRDSQKSTLDLVQLATTIADTNFNIIVLEDYIGPLKLTDSNQSGYFYEGVDFQTRDGFAIHIERAYGRPANGLEGLSNLILRIDVEKCYTSTIAISEFNLSASERAPIPGSPHAKTMQFHFQRQLTALGLGTMNLGFSANKCLDTISFLK
ncbi:MAG TPA: hypothetical protein VN247_02460 [Arenimonas sp.]|nr:hypothetical protein [Arenimonas sp.]